MTLFKAPGRPVPKITKQYRLLHRTGGRATYLTVTAEGSELLMLDPSGSSFRHSICGACVDCAPGAVCAWQECPNRNRLEEPARRSPLQAVEHEPVSIVTRP